MRLTLRTLLAYLDDVLEPNEAREIGQKINQSKEATELVTQIREAIRRRRIGAPELAGPGSGPDPNIVSEYLENVLSPNQVVEFEKLCRGSELHLAEVAACHKILTMVMGQPIDVSDELRERMYDLGATKAAVATSQEPAPKAVPQMTSGMGTATASSFNDDLPDYLKKGRGTSRIWSTLLVLAIAGIWVALVVSDQSIWNNGEKDQVAENAADVEPVIDDEQPSGGNVAAGGEDPIAAAKQGENAHQQDSTAGPATKAQATVSINPPPPAEGDVAAASIPKPNVTGLPSLPQASPQMQTGKTQNSDADGTTAKPSEVVAVTKVNGAAQKLPADGQKPQLGSSVPKIPLVILPPEEITMLHPEGTDRWVTADSGEIGFGDSFAVPEPFEAKLNFRGDLTLALFGGTRLKRLPEEEGVDLAIQLERGHLLIERPETSIHERVVTVMVGENAWRFEFKNTGTELAAGVVLPQPEGRIFDDAPLPPTGGFAVTQGDLVAHIGGGEIVKLKRSSGWVSWSEKIGELLIDEPSAIPAWTEPDAVLMTPARSQLSKAYEREFRDDVLQSIAPVISDRRAIIAEFAVKTMALTDNYLEIVPALQSDHEEARMTAIAALREWLAEEPSRIEVLREEMDRLFRPELSEQISDMLWGYSREDAQSTETSQMLVELLAHEDLAIRELAHFYVTTLSGRNYGYHSQAPLAERNAAINRWVEFVKRDKSLVKPD